MEHTTGTAPIAFGVRLEYKGISLDLQVRVAAESLPADAVGGIDLQLLLDEAHHGLLAGAESLALVMQKEACRILGVTE